MHPSSKDISDYITIVANLALVGVGIWGILVALKTVRAAENNAVAAKDGAEASLLNAKALINAERPWLVVEATGFEYMSFTMVNKGRTPAQLIWYNNFPSMSLPEPGESMNKPRYGAFYEENSMQIMNIPMIFPEGKMDAGAYNLSALREGNPELWEEIRTMKKLFYLYSAIKYKGPFSDAVYETRYCFRVTSNGPVMLGDPSYNQHT